MRKLLVTGLCFISALSFAQSKKPKYNLSDRAADHFMLQLSSDHWLGLPDSIKDHVKGTSRGLNAYLMIDKPFRSNPKLSFAFGLGVSTSNIFFKRMYVDITNGSRTLPFVNQDTTQHYKKFKLTTAYLEIPIEFRFMSDPENVKKSFKFALGVKGGTSLNMHTKGKTLQNAAGNTLKEGTFKQSSKAYFNNTRFSATARVGYGLLSLFGAYTFSPMFKDGVAAPDIRNLQVGITISGL